MTDHEQECCSRWRVWWTYAQIAFVSLILAAVACGLAGGVFMRAYAGVAGSL